jgi:DNA-directed RNA polymerase specialized sigma24 family protein
VSRETDSDFEEFFSARSLTLRRTAYVLCGDWSLAEELTQIALVKVYAQWHRLRRDGADAYARRVLINASASRWRNCGTSNSSIPFPTHLHLSDHATTTS